MEPYIEFIGTLQKSGFWLVKGVTSPITSGYQVPRLLSNPWDKSIYLLGLSGTTIGTQKLKNESVCH